jgi:hypothetical protein
MAKEQGRRVAAAFGPVKEWKVVYSKCVQLPHCNRPREGFRV